MLGRWSRWTSWLGGTRLFLAVIAAGIIVAIGEPVLATLRGNGRDPVDRPTATVRRAHLSTDVLAPGRVASWESTEIKCTLERLEGAGQSGSSGASTILSLVPDGARVEKGDILCELDAADFKELERRQQIVVEQAAADQLGARLALDIAQLAMQSYRDGEQRQAERDFQVQITLSGAELARQQDRVDWSRRMLDKGYVSLAQLRTEEQAREKLLIGIRQAELRLSNYLRFTAPKDLIALQGTVIGAQATFGFQSIRYEREKARLAHYRRLIADCTVRAPHSGLVVYANRSGREPRVFLGAPVRERMRLFFLPDPTKLEAEVLLHETVVSGIRTGMPARIRLEALPGRILEGRVESITPVPMSDQSAETSSGVTFFLGHVRLGPLPPEVLPGMTAEVQIAAGKPEEVLTIPNSSVAFDEDQAVCYVEQGEGVERRPVRIGQATRDVLEVVEGLEEGEEVLLDLGTMVRGPGTTPAR